MQVYELIFEVTETCNNGNERRKKVSVYSMPFRYGRFVIECDRVNEGIELLKQQHYYNIKHIKTKLKTLLFTE